MPELLVAAFIFATGAAIGSFLNVVILRYPDQSLTGRSACPDCQRTLTWRELIPVLSYLALRGKCRNCQNPIAVQYPLVELAYGLAAVAVLTPLPVQTISLTIAVLDLLIIAQLLILFVIDLRTFLLPDAFIIAASLLAAARVVLTQSDGLAAATGAASGAGFLLLLWLVTKGQGIGLGDVKLMVPIGLLFAPAATIAHLMVSFVAGGLLSVWLLAAKKAGLKTAVPFGPFLAGTAIVFIVAPQIPAAMIRYLIG